jgi:hypothetical protein
MLGNASIPPACFLEAVWDARGPRTSSAAADGRSGRWQQAARDEPPELRQGSENGATPAAGDVPVILDDGWVNHRMGGALRTGEVFGQEISQQRGPL